jgi:hypothetical protein
MTFVEFEHGLWWQLSGHRRGFEHLVIKGNGQFAFVQVGAKEDMSAPFGRRE